LTRAGRSAHSFCINDLCKNPRGHQPDLHSQIASIVVEGSQGLTMAEERDGDLCFSATLPNLVVGTVGNG